MTMQADYLCPEQARNNFCRVSVAQVLVLETCGGLVTGAVAERLGGFGTVCSVHTGRSPPSQDAVRMFNFPWAMRDSLCCASLERLSAAAEGDSSPSQQQAHEQVQANQLANVTATSAPASAAAARLGQAQAEPVPLGADASQPPGAPGSDLAASAAGQHQSTVMADVSMHSTEAACDYVQPSADGVTDQEAVTREVLPCDTATDACGTSDQPPAASAAPVQLLKTTAPITELDNGTASAAARIPRNMEPKRCVTAVPPARFEQLQALVRHGFGSCLIAAPALQPAAAVQRLLPFLAPSASFVVYSPFLQPLAEAMTTLQASKAATNLQLQVRRRSTACFCPVSHALWAICDMLASRRCPAT